jgi:hypothetical protein
LENENTNNFIIQQGAVEVDPYSNSKDERKVRSFGPFTLDSRAFHVFSSKEVESIRWKGLKSLKKTFKFLDEPR